MSPTKSFRNASKQFVIAGVSVLVIAGILYWLIDGSGTIPQGSEGASTANAESGAAETESDAFPQPPATPQQAAKPARQSTDPPLWRPVDEAKMHNLPFFAKEWSTEGRALVRVSGAAEAARAWHVGDRLTIPLPQLGETYYPVIEEIDDGPGYSRAAEGMITDSDGYPRRVVITVGPTSVFAYIDTPEGPYELAADSDFGWLLPTASMMAGYDFSVPDYILPENGQRHP